MFSHFSCWIPSVLLTFIPTQTVHVDQMSGASTVLFTFTLDRGITWEVNAISIY